MFRWRVVCTVLVAALAGFAAPARAAATWQPAPGLVQVPLWPGAVPDPLQVAGPERLDIGHDRVGGKTVQCETNVTRPTLTFYPPKGPNTGVTVLVFPGGGYDILAMDLEGTEVCDWLNARGIAAVLLKYRVPSRSARFRTSPRALQDAQRSLGWVRHHAAALHVDPHKIGVLGFSAGGHLVVDLSTHFARRAYPPVDAADRESCRPDFVVALYPGHMAIPEDDFDARTRRALDTNSLNGYRFNPDVRPPRNAPPTFLLQAEDDHVDHVEQALLYFAELKQAGVPAELHLYAHGGHAFGLRRTRDPITAWPDLVLAWLGTIGMLPPGT